MYLIQDSISILLIGLYTGMVFGRMYYIENRINFLERKVFYLEDIIFNK